MDETTSIENVESKVINKINEKFGSDVLKLSESDDLQKNLEEEKKNIENSVSTENIQMKKFK